MIKSFRKKGFENKEAAVDGIQRLYGAADATVICPWAEEVGLSEGVRLIRNKNIKAHSLNSIFFFNDDSEALCNADYSASYFKKTNVF